MRICAIVFCLANINIYQAAVCPDLEAPAGYAGIYDVSLCQSKSDGQSCSVSCFGPSIGGSVTCTCTDSVLTCATFPTCVEAALQPSQVVGKGVGSDSVELTWLDSSLKDCGSRGLFDYWEVQQSINGVAWSNAGGTCNANPATQCSLNQRCTASGLSADTVYDFRVKAKCTNAALDSPYSAAALASTYPAPAAAPTFPSDFATSSTVSSVTLKWTAGADNGCTFSHWDIEVRDPTETWTNNRLGCTNLYSKAAADTTCTLVDLQCGTNYLWRVTHRCTNPGADSPPSAEKEASTLSSITCFVAAGPPTDTSAFMLSHSTVALAWNPGKTNDCDFKMWEVLFQTRSADGVSQPFTQTGCTRLTSRSIDTCTATDLTEKYYRFAVREVCKTDSLSSYFSAFSQWVQKTLHKASAPTRVLLSNAQQTSLKLSWMGSDLNDCVFRAWSIILQTGDSAYQQNPLGCASIRQFQTQECVLVGLTSNTAYKAKVSVLCDEFVTPAASTDSADSEDSLESLAVHTLLQPASMPTSFSVSNVGEDVADFDWVAATESLDCSFKEWIVEVQEAATLSWYVPFGCESTFMAERNTDFCGGMLLPCGTTFVARVRESCADSVADSPYRYSAAFSTTGTCLKKAKPPVGVSITSPTASSFYVSFLGGEVQDDCIFEKFEVQRKTAGDVSAEWISACADITVRKSSSCTVSGLAANTGYYLRVREACQNSNLNSGWVSPQTDFRTLEVGALSITDTFPIGAITESQPTHAIVVFSSPIMMPDSALQATFWATGCQNIIPDANKLKWSVEPFNSVSAEMENYCKKVAEAKANAYQTEFCCGQAPCSPTCAKQTALSKGIELCPTETTGCSCYSASQCEAKCQNIPYDAEDGGIVSLLGNQALTWKFPSLPGIRPFCTYNLRIAGGFVRTASTPATFMPAHSWSFTYSPNGPHITDLALTSSSQTTLVIAIAFDVPADFSCLTSPIQVSSGNLEYTGVGAVSMYFSGLEPSTSYDIKCTSYLAGTTVMSEQTRGAFETDDDTNGRLSALTVIGHRVCSDPTYSGDVSPFFNPLFETTHDGGTYEVKIDVAEYRTKCATAASQNVTAFYQMRVSATAASSFASIVYDPPSQEIALIMPWYEGSIPPSVSQEVKIQVWPKTGGKMAAVTFKLIVSALYQDFIVEGMTQSIGEGQIMVSGASQSMTVDAMFPGTSQSTAVDVNDVNIFLGGFLQARTSSSVSSTVSYGQPAQRCTFTIANPVGYGIELPIIISWSGSVYQSKYTVSFSTPVITQVSTVVAGQSTPYASTVANTDITVSGYNLGANVNAGGAAQIYVTNRDAKATTVQRPYILTLTFQVQYQNTLGGSYKLVRPHFPLPIVNSDKYAAVCNRAAPIWIGGLAVLCWSTVRSESDRWMVYYVTSSTPNPSSYGTITCPDGYATDAWKDPRNCGSPTGFLTNVQDGAPELYSLLELNLAFDAVAAYNSLAGTYALSLPGEPIWSAYSNAYTACDTTKHKWISGNAVFCWVSNAYSVLHTADGSAASSIGTLECATYKSDPTQCGGSFQGGLTSVTIPTGARRLRDGRRLVYTPDGTMESNGYVNLCGPTTFVSSTELKCTLPPTLLNPLHVDVAVRNGAGTWLASTSANPNNPAEMFKLSPPVVGDFDVTTQPISSATSFIVTGENFPAAELTFGYMQLYASPETTISLPVNTDTHLALCTQMVRISAQQARCDRYSNWNGSVLRTTLPNVWMQVSPTLVSEAPLNNVLTIPQIQIFNITRSDKFEVPEVTYTFIGQGFGNAYGTELEVIFITEGKATRPWLGTERRLQKRRLQIDYSALSGLIHSTCDLSSRNDTHIECRMRASNIFTEPLGDSDYAYLHDATEPAPAYPVKLRIRFAQMSSLAVASGGSLLQGFADFSVELFTCGAGLHRASKTNRTCNWCPYGKYSDRYTAQLECEPCPIGRFANYQRTVTCVECIPENFSTVTTGSIYRTDCGCAPGYERDRTRPRSDGPWDTGICKPCPENSGCDGGDTRAYSLAGYWTPNRKKFWSCSPPVACDRGNPVQANVCAEGHWQKSRRCSECDTKYYRYRAHCYYCNPAHMILGYALPLGLIVICFCVIIPMFVKQNQRQHAVLEVIYGVQLDDDDEDDTSQKIGKPQGTAVGKRNFGKKAKREGCCKRCVKRCNPTRRWPPQEWPRFVQEIVTRPKIRLLMLMTTRCQLLWALIMMPVDWPEAVYFLRELVLSAFVIDFDVLRIECVIDVNYYVKFFVQWSAPFVLFLTFAIALKGNSCYYRNQDHPKYIYFTGTLYEVMSVLICFLTTGHFAADLNFLRCEPCEDSPRHCLVDFPGLGCATDEGWWMTLAAVSIADLALIVLPCLAIVFMALYKSWCWQHGAGSGLDKHGKKLWHLYIADFWVKDYKGFSEHLRIESVHLREYLKNILHRGLNGANVWQRLCFQYKMRKWYLTEKKVESQIAHIIAAATNQRKIQDAKAMNKQEEDKYDGDNRLCAKICACFWWMYSNLLRCRICRKKKDGPRKLKRNADKTCRYKAAKCCKCVCKCIVCAPFYFCKAICSFTCPDKRWGSRNKRANPYKKKVEDKSVPKFDELEKLEKGMTGMLREDAEEAARINELAALDKFKAAKVKKIRDMNRLLQLLSATEEFILENELSTSFWQSLRSASWKESMFWAYIWEYIMLWQKILTIIVSTFAPSTGYPEEAIACCMFFQLVVMVLQIDIEPFEWNLLNDISMTADIVTFYMILFSQLKWKEMLGLSAYVLVAVVTVPALIRCVFPSIRRGKMFDDDGLIVDSPAKPKSYVELAVFEEALGVNGMRLFRRVQKRWRQMYTWKKYKGNKSSEDVSLKKLYTQQAKQTNKLKEKFQGREHLVDKLENLPKALKGPVETVLKVGWSKVNWPSNHTAVHVAAELGSKEGIQILAEAKANLTSEDAWHHTPLDYADSGGYQEVSDLILKLAPSAYRSTPVEAADQPSSPAKAAQPTPQPKQKPNTLASTFPDSSSRPTDERSPLVQSAQTEQYLSNQRLPPAPLRRPKAKPLRSSPLSDDFASERSVAAKNSPRPPSRSSTDTRRAPTRSVAQGNIPTVHRMSIWHDDGTDGSVARNLLAHEAEAQSVTPEAMRQRRRPAGRGRRAAAAERAASPSANIHNF